MIRRSTLALAAICLVTAGACSAPPERVQSPARGEPPRAPAPKAHTARDASVLETPAPGHASGSATPKVGPAPKVPLGPVIAPAPNQPARIPYWDVAPEGAPGDRYAAAAFDGRLSGGDVVRLILERTNDQVTASGVVISTKKAREVTFKGSADGGQLVLNETGAVPAEPPAQLTARLDPSGTLVGTWSRGNQHDRLEARLSSPTAPRTPSAAAQRTADGAVKSTTGGAAQSRTEKFRGRVGARTAFFAQLRFAGTGLEGVYQYDGANDDLLLSGSMKDTGQFTIEERNRNGQLTGSWKGVFDSVWIARGIWIAPDNQRTLPFKLTPGSAYTPIVQVGGGVRVYPVDHSRSFGGSCSALSTFPQVAGMKNRALQKQLNERLKSAGMEDLDETSCPVDAESSIHTSSTRDYGVTGVRAPWVGITVNHEWSSVTVNSMSECYVADTERGELHQLKEFVTQPGWAELDVLALRKLHAERSPPPDAGGTPMTPQGVVTEQTALCLDPRGVLVRLHDYSVGAYPNGRIDVLLPAAEVRAYFRAPYADVFFGPR